MPTDAGTLPALLRHQAQARADHPLLICDDERLTYADADRRSAQLARGLVALGVGKGSHVGLLYPNGAAFVVGMLAAARIGAVVVPFSTLAAAGELAEQLRDSDVEILLCARSYRSHDFRARLAEVRAAAELPCLRRVLVDEQPAGDCEQSLLAALEDDVDASDTLAIVYTSGSTGRPKGAVHTHGALLAHQRNLNRIRGLAADDKLFCNSPFFWIGGFAFGLLATLVAGSTLLCSAAADAGVTLDLLEAEQPTVTNGFVAGIAHLTRHPSFAHRDLSGLRRGNLYPIMAPDRRPADPELRHNMLGMTEAGSVVLLSADDADQPEHRRGSFGKPAPGVDAKVVEPDTGAAVERGMTGELCVRGAFLMQRYYGRSREECFDADGWFHTGDLVRTDADGYFYFLGRRDAMIKTSGANVAPAEVERAITKLTGAPAYVIGLPDAERGQVVAAVVALDDGRDFDEAAVRARLGTELSAYKIPRRFATPASADVPLTSGGKVDYARLAGFFDG